MNPILFSNVWEIENQNLTELINRWNKYNEIIDDYPLLQNIKIILGKDYFEKAKEWWNVFKNADWYREDLV